MSYRLFPGATTQNINTSGNLTATGSTITLGTAAGTNTVAGNTTFSQNVNLNGNTTIGNAAGDVVTVTGTATFAENATFTGDIAVNGGDITTTSTTATVFNTGATTLNIGGAATTVSIGAATGTSTINNSLQVNGDTTLGNADADRTTVRGGVKFANDANTFFTTIQALGGLAADYTLTLPPDAGTSGQILRTDGAGVLTWVNDAASTALVFVTETGNATAATTTDVVLVNAATATITVPVGTNKRYYIKKINAGAGDITITPSSGQIYDASGLVASTVISGDGESIEVAADGTNLYVI